MTQKQIEQADAISKLRQMLKPGDTVYTIIRNVSRSGMSREIGVVIMSADGSQVTDLHPNYLVSKACGYRMGKRDGLIVGGCGMDMGFSVVYDLGHKLFPDGFGIWPNGGEDMPKTGTFERPKTAARAAEMVSEGFKFHGRNGDASGWDNDGGYALKQRWL